MEAFNYDSVSSAIDRYLQMKILIKDESYGDSKRIQLGLKEPQWKDLVEKINSLRSEPSKDIDEVIQIVQRILMKEFLIPTKL